MEENKLPQKIDSLLKKLGKECEKEGGDMLYFFANDKYACYLTNTTDDLDRIADLMFKMAADNHHDSKVFQKLMIDVASEIVRHNPRTFVEIARNAGFQVATDFRNDMAN